MVLLAIFAKGTGVRSLSRERLEKLASVAVAGEDLLHTWREEDAAPPPEEREP